MTNEDYKKVSDIIDVLSLVSKVSRHAWFRFVYLGNKNDLRDNVRYMIQERILCCQGHNKLIDANKLEELVSRFLAEVSLPDITDSQISMARTEPSNLVNSLL